jgi:hypothetical protein
MMLNPAKRSPKGLAFCSLRSKAAIIHRISS